MYLQPTWKHTHARGPGWGTGSWEEAAPVRQYQRDKCDKSCQQQVSELELNTGAPSYECSQAVLKKHTNTQKAGTWACVPALPWHASQATPAPCQLSFRTRGDVWDSKCTNQKQHACSALPAPHALVKQVRLGGRPGRNRRPDTLKARPRASSCTNALPMTSINSRR